MCGGTNAPRRDWEQKRGLSPRVRGEPRWPCPPSSTMTVYPRVCGGTPPSLRLRSPPAGLSPRVRGNLLHRLYIMWSLRSIPACAGEPHCRGRRSIQGAVYPRVWRGNLYSPSPPCTLVGSIPACAGEPLSNAACALPSEVYPRVCGGTYIGLPSHRRATGLSPRVRGNRTPARRRASSGGSIPACAGEP